MSARSPASLKPSRISLFSSILLIELLALALLKIYSWHAFVTVTAGAILAAALLPFFLSALRWHRARVRDANRKYSLWELFGYLTAFCLLFAIFPQIGSVPMTIAWAGFLASLIGAVYTLALYGRRLQLLGALLGALAGCWGTASYLLPTEATHSFNLVMTSIFLFCAVLGLISWIRWDSRKSLRSLRQQRRAQEQVTMADAGTPI